MTEKEKGYLTAYPMLFIGLGGTGVNVLLRLRFWMTFGRAEQIRWPIYGFQIIDTDTNLRPPSKASSMRLLMEEFGFGAEDVLRIGIDKNIVDRIKEHAPGRPGWRRVDVGGSLVRLGSLVDGAGQTRGAGTVAFIYNGKKVVEALRRKLSYIKSDDARRVLLDKGVEVDPTTHVHVVLSVAGGTGSGGLTEILGVLDYLKSTSFPSMKIHLYIFLADLFRDILSPQQSERAYANTYAALRELEFLAQGGEKVTYIWDDLSGTNPIQHTATTPLFNSAYIFSAQTFEEKGKLDVDDAAEMLASYFYNLINSPSTPAMDKLSQIINAEANIGNYTVHLARTSTSNTAQDSEHSSRETTLQLPAACRYTSLGVVRIKSDIPASVQKEVLKAIKEHLELTVFGEDKTNEISAKVSSFPWVEWIESIFKGDNYIRQAYSALTSDVNYKNPKGWVTHAQRLIKDAIENLFRENLKKVLEDIERAVEGSVEEIANEGLRPLETFYNEVVRRLKDEHIIKGTVPKVPRTEELVFQRLPQYIEDAQNLDSITKAVWGDPSSAIAKRLKSSLIEREIADFLNNKAIRIWKRSIAYLVERYEGESKKVRKLINYFNKLIEELDKKADAIYETFKSLQTPYEYEVKQQITEWRDVKDDIDKELRNLTEEGGELHPYTLYKRGEGKIRKIIIETRDRLIPIALRRLTSYLQIKEDKDCSRTAKAYNNVPIAAKFMGTVDTHKYVILPRNSDSLSCSEAAKWEKQINPDEGFYLFIIAYIKDFQFIQNFQNLKQFRESYIKQISHFNASIFRSLLGYKLPPLEIPKNWFDLLDVAKHLIVVSLAGGLADYKGSSIKIKRKGGMGAKPPVVFEDLWDAVLRIANNDRWREEIARVANTVIQKVKNPGDNQSVQTAAKRFAVVLKLFYDAVYNKIRDLYGVDPNAIVEGRVPERMSIPLPQVAYFTLLAYTVKRLEEDTALEDIYRDVAAADPYVLLGNYRNDLQEVTDMLLPRDIRFYALKYNDLRTLAGGPVLLP